MPLLTFIRQLRGSDRIHLARCGILLFYVMQYTGLCPVLTSRSDRAALPGRLLQYPRCEHAPAEQHAAGAADGRGRRGGRPAGAARLAQREASRLHPAGECLFSLPMSSKDT